MKEAIWGAILLTVLAAIAGCSETPPSTDATTVGNTPATTAAASDNVQLTLADENDLQTIVDKNRGKVVMFDFWATWCGPCVESFPHTVGLSKKHPADQFAVVTLSLDDLASEPEALAFLKEQGATHSTNLISKYDGVGTDVPEKLGFDGSIPYFRLYDRSGKQRYEWAGLPDDLDQKVEELLAEPAPTEPRP